jgi:ribosomal protein S18 acetylase RimI-like enzyme
MQIRLVRPDEGPILQAFARACFVTAFAPLNTPEDMALYLKDHLTPESIAREMKQPDSRFYFVEKGNELVAYAKINAGIEQTEQALPNALEVERIYVHADWQGKGIGARLLKFLVDLAKKENFNHIWLGVWEENISAIRFYQRYGFRIFSQHDFYLGTDLQTDVMLKYSF